MCAPEGEACKIQCGAGQFREGKYCYYCHDIGKDYKGGFLCAACSADKPGTCGECIAGYGLTATNECEECTGNTWSYGATGCLPVEHCKDAFHDRPGCSLCDPGHRLVDSSSDSDEWASDEEVESSVWGEQVCVECAAHEHGDGKKCSAVDRCAVADHSTTAAVCLECKPGYILQGDKCVACTGTMYSAGGTATECETVQHCDSGFDTVTPNNEPNCQTCDTGFGLTDSKECEACTGTQYDDGTATTCQTVQHCDSGFDTTTLNSAPNCKTCETGYGLTASKECEACATGTTYSSGRTACTDRCPAFSGSEAVCAAAGFCLWNGKYRVCYAEQQSTFTEVVVTEGTDAEDVAAALEEEHPGVVAVVVADESGRQVVMVYGDEEALEAIRRIPSECGAEGSADGVLCSGIEATNAVDAAAVAAAPAAGGKVSKGAFVAGVVAGGCVILALVAAIVAQLVKRPSVPLLGAL